MNLSLLIHHIFANPVEADPKTVRKCGSYRAVPDAKDQCKEKLTGNNKMIVCKCGTALCNKAATRGTGWRLWLVFALLLKTIIT